MKYKAEITIQDPLIYDAIRQEQTEQGRAKTKFTKDKESTKIEIEANDPVALKAHVNSAIKMIETWEKMQKVK